MRIALLFAALLCTAVPCSAVYYGQTKAELLKELGKPNSVLARGNREVMIYGEGRAELVDGRVVSIQRLPVTEGAPAAPIAAPESVASATEPPPAEEVKHETDAADDAEAVLPRGSTVEQALADLENLHRAEPEEKDPVQLGIAAMAAIAINWLLMLAALKLTCKYWAVEVSWIGLMIAAGVDTAVRALVAYFGKVVMEMPSLFYADEAIALFVLVFVLRKVSYNQRLSQAVTIAMTSKVFSVVVGSIVALALMHALF